MSERKIGAGHANAMFRQGIRELRAAMYPESNVAQQAEYGIAGTMTPGEVAEARRNDGREMEEETSRGSVLEDRIRQTDARGGHEREDKPLEMER